MKGIEREFSVPRTPQQNSIAERKNRTFIEAAKVMLADSLLPIPFWAEAVNTACYVHNRVLVTKPHNKTPYKLLHGRTPSIGFMRPFGCPVTILNTLDSLGKFEGKVDEGFLVGYSVNSKFKEMVDEGFLVGYSTFITSIENQLSLKVKVIRSDNGTEFKNNDLNQFCGMKGIKREFGVPRTPQQNGIAERKNRTLIKAARTMLADLLLPIPFWAEAVNTACYVQNRVLVTKPHNKTPYELLHGRTPSIGFMRPFGCPVDEGFLVGYSVNSKAFRVFNSRTRIIQETLHVNFLENKPNVTGSGPTWLFDIDSLTRTMNYQPVITGNQTNPSAGFQDKFDAEKAGEEVDQQYVLFLVWSSGSINPRNYDRDGDVAFDEKEHDFDVKKPESEVILSPSSRYRDLTAEFEDCSDNNSNEVNAVGSIVPTVGHNSLNSTNTFSVVGPSNADVSPTYRKSSFIDASQLPDDPDMPELEDITYSDDEDVVGAKADFNNLESSISEELLQFKMQKVWVLVDLPHRKRAIGTKWVYMNKKDERGIVIRNKARLVAQRHTQARELTMKKFLHQ
nr:ribonuclease H-like domain-containing protein [Tanacetum cinerariifolium]